MVKGKKEKPDSEEIELDPMYLEYNPSAAKGLLPNPNEKFITDDDDDDSASDENEDEEDSLELDEDEELTDEEIERLLKLPDDRLKKFGIDDPKQWKNYQRALTKTIKEKKELEGKLNGGQFSNDAQTQIKKLEDEINALKNPKKQPEPLKRPTRPVPPTMPKGFNWTDVGVEGSASQAYMAAKTEYDNLLVQYQIDFEAYNAQVQEGLMSELKQERQARTAANEQQQIRRSMVNQLMEQGLNAAEANAAFEAALNPEFYSPDVIAMGYKVKTGKKFKLGNGDGNPRRKRTSKRDRFFAPAHGGGSPTNEPRRGEYSSDKDTSDFYKIRKA